MAPSLAIIIVSLCGYAMGCLPFAQLTARRCGIADLRSVGDRNPGFWNLRELAGVRAALPVFAGDVAKGAAAAGLGAALADGRWWLAYVGAGAAMVGHAFPVTARWRGGRSVLTFVGGMIVAAPAPAAIAVGALAVCFVAARRFDWAARLGFVAFPVAQLAIDGPRCTAATGLLMTFIGVRFVMAESQVASRSRLAHARETG